MRVAAAAESPACAAALSVVTCSRTSSGHADERATIFATDDLSVSSVASFGSNAAQLNQGREVVRLCREDLLDQRLKLFRSFLIALAFDFLREFIDRDQVVLVQLD